MCPLSGLCRQYESFRLGRENICYVNHVPAKLYHLNLVCFRNLDCSFHVFSRFLTKFSKNASGVKQRTSGVNLRYSGVKKRTTFWLHFTLRNLAAERFFYRNCASSFIILASCRVASLRSLPAATALLLFTVVHPTWPRRKRLLRKSRSRWRNKFRIGFHAHSSHPCT